MVSLTATDAGAMSPPRVGLSLAWDIDTDVTIVRIDPDGTARPVRGCEPLRLTGTTTWSGFDYEAPLNVDVVYEASAPSGTRRVSGTVRCTAVAFYPNDQGWSTARGAVWLRHLSIPDLSMPVDLANAETPSYAQTRTVVPVLNRSAPVVLADARRKAPTTTLGIRTWSLEEAARLRELLADNSVLLLDVPAPERWGISHWWIAVGDVAEERLWQEWAPFEGRVFHLPVEVVDRPPGGTVHTGRTYWSAQRGVATYYQWQRMYGTYAALAAAGGGFGGPYPDPDPDPAPEPDPDFDPVEDPGPVPDPDANYVINVNINDENFGTKGAGDDLIVVTGEAALIGGGYYRAQWGLWLYGPDNGSIYGELRASLDPITPGNISSAIKLPGNAWGGGAFESLLSYSTYFIPPTTGTYHFAVRVFNADGPFSDRTRPNRERTLWVLDDDGS